MTTTSSMMSKFTRDKNLNTSEGWQELLLAVTYYAENTVETDDEIAEKLFAQSGLRALHALLSFMKSEGLDGVYAVLEREFERQRLSMVTLGDLDSMRAFYSTEFTRLLFLKVKELRSSS